MRNRRYISREGPLIVYRTEGAKLVKAFMSIHSVEVANVERLNLLKLAPGGDLGRFVIWTKSAFEKLGSIYGSFEKTIEKKRVYVLPRAKMVTAEEQRKKAKKRPEAVVVAERRCGGGDRRLLRPEGLSIGKVHYAPEDVHGERQDMPKNG
ncbi:hypothetical protein L1987_61161 [Smallanthus sonchifolius]|uniref:Uncharacterized protein n=1 Tax=Smallanthus sonchifolius TaxID=185202 RepID=A0ACB9DA46_9ASTR|nr:hypothetical protein L1987_61161 [Smallanthus sonchifolius]